MTNQSATALAPILYLPHGGGPLPLLGDKSHAALVTFLKEIPSTLGEPEAILVISAHWEQDRPTLTAAQRPELIYDYSGFPPQAYDIAYPAPGEPQLAAEIFAMLAARGIKARLDSGRGFDHGLFVPLKLMYPDAHIPCVQLSLLSSLDPAAHIAVGKALSELRKKNILIIGSGMSYHNMKTFFAHDAKSLEASETFNHWLIETCTTEDMLPDVREQGLVNWATAPAARYCHPREEHLLPLHVCYGIACAETRTAETVFDQNVMGKKVCGLLWR